MICTFCSTYSKLNTLVLSQYQRFDFEIIRYFEKGFNHNTCRTGDAVKWAG